MEPVTWFGPWVAKVSAGIVTLPVTFCDPMVPANVGKSVSMPPSLPLRASSLAEFSVTATLIERLPHSPVYVPVTDESSDEAWHDVRWTVKGTPPSVPLAEVPTIPNGAQNPPCPENPPATPPIRCTDRGQHQAVHYSLHTSGDALLG